MHLIRQAFIMSDLEFTKPQPLHLYSKNNVPRSCEEGMKCPHFLPVSAVGCTGIHCSHSIFTQAGAATQGRQLTCPGVHAFHLVSPRDYTGIPIWLRFLPHGRRPLQRAGALISFKCCFMKCVKQQF